MRIIFAGTPDFAAIHLQGILDANEHEVIAVYTQPDRPAGRGKKLSPSPVKQLAQDHQLPAYQPLNFKAEHDQQQLAALNADIMVVVAYGLLLPTVILNAPRLGCINVHGSLLPRWRGAAPIQRAIEAGDGETGIVIMQMDEGLDTGDMLLTARCDITAEDTSTTLFDKLAVLGVPTLNQALNKIAAGTINATPQDDSQSNYAKKISKAEAAIDWRLPAQEIHRKIRAFNPFPIATTDLGDQRIKIWQAAIGNQQGDEQQGEAGSIIQSDKKSITVACGEGSLQLQKIQLPGGKVLDIPAVMNSKADWFAVGRRFGDSVQT